MAEVTTESSLFEVRPSMIHGTGVFARADIAEGTKIVEYVGERLDKDESLRRREAGNFFVFTVTDDYDIDGLVDWNPSRFINHSCVTNCEAQEEDEHIWIIALRNIKAGEELSFNYGYDLEDYQDHPCACGASGCLGFMVAEEHFDEVRRLEKQREK